MIRLPVASALLSGAILLAPIGVAAADEATSAPADAKAAKKADRKKEKGARARRAVKRAPQRTTVAGKTDGTAAATRLFILSGQSNMAGLDEATTLVPALVAAFPDDELIIVKDAQSGQPIRRWYAGWQPPAGWQGRNARDKPGNNDLYRRLWQQVEQAIKGKTLTTTSFIWMQGEADAKRGTFANYEDSLRGLIKQVRTDLGRPDTTVVVGRLSDHMAGKKGWDSVRQAQMTVAAADPIASWVDTDAYNGPKDGLHYTRTGYDQLGAAFAAAAIALLKQPAAKP
jgi:hypothetical protein